MAKNSTSGYECNSCGSKFVKSFGQCPRCKEWGSIREIDEEFQRPGVLVSMFLRQEPLPSY
jgi:predicted ATP-dependent serine protease